MKKSLILIGSVTLFIVLLLYAIYCQHNGIRPYPWVGLSLIFLIFTSLILLLVILNEKEKKEEKERQIEFIKNEKERKKEWIDYINKLKLLNRNYRESLLNKDGKAAHLGELYYNFRYQPTNIFQQNQILLKIQNDILSHSQIK